MTYDDRLNLFKKAKDYISLNPGNYNKIITYYEKNFLKNEYINYYELDNRECLSRTNNYIEIFHDFLNSILESYHPKLSYLIDKYIYIV